MNFNWFKIVSQIGNKNYQFIFFSGRMYEASHAMTNTDFVKAAKLIETGSIQPNLVENIVKQQIDRNRLKYAYPAIIGNAEIHRDAYKFGYNKAVRGQPPQVCACCMEKVQTEQIGICYRTSSVEVEQEMGYQQFKLRPGIALFFSFIKMIIVYFIFRLIICEGFNLITNIISGQYCMDESQTECHPILWNLLSIYNKKNNSKLILIQDILILVVIVLSVVFFFLYRKRQYNKAKILNDRNQVEEDYTLLIENIPLIDFPSKNENKKQRMNQDEISQLYHREHLWKFFQHKIKNWVDKKEHWRKGNNQADFENLRSKNNGQLKSNQIVKSIILCYNLQRLETLQNERDQLIKNRKKYEQLRKEIDNDEDSSLGIAEVQADNRFSSVPMQVGFINDCEVILNKQYASDNSVLFNITNFAGKAFISFQYQHYRQFILEQADRDLNFLYFNGSRLKVSRVSNPKDINWKNLRHSREKQNKKLWSTIYILLVIIVLTFGVLCALEYGRRQAVDALNNDQNSIFGKIGSYGFTALSIIAIALANQIIMSTATNRTRQQCHYSKAQETLSIVLKVVICQFICTAILPYAVSRVFQSQFASKTGLIYQMTALILFYGLFMNIFSILFPEAMFRSLKLFCNYRNRQPQDQVDKFQVQLNKQFEYVEFDIVNRYCNFIQLAFVTCFYAYMIPVLTVILVVVFFLQFWIDKINLFKRCSHPRNFSFYLTRNILKIFEACIWIFALGTYIFGIYIHNSALNILNLVGLGIASIYLWFLVGASIKLERNLFGSYQSSQNAIYDQCVASGKFEQTYWTENPATFLVKESDVTGRQSVANPALNRTFVTYSTS